MQVYKVKMSDGICIEVLAFKEADAMRTAERKSLGRAFGSRAISAALKEI